MKINRNSRNCVYIRDYYEEWMSVTLIGEDQNTLEKYEEKFKSLFVTFEALGLTCLKKERNSNSSPPNLFACKYSISRISNILHSPTGNEEWDYISGLIVEAIDSISEEYAVSVLRDLDRRGTRKILATNSELIQQFEYVPNDQKFDPAEEYYQQILESRKKIPLFSQQLPFVPFGNSNLKRSV
jgi:hypothetical protein